MKIHLQRHFAICINMPLKSENGQKLHIGPFCSEPTMHPSHVWYSMELFYSSMGIETMPCKFCGECDSATLNPLEYVKV